MTDEQKPLVELNEDGLVPGEVVDPAAWALIEHKRYQEQLKAMKPEELAENKPAARKRG